MLIKLRAGSRVLVMVHSMVWHRRCWPSQRMLDTYYSKEKYADLLKYAGELCYDFSCYA
jgi:hypothetical protein